MRLQTLARLYCHKSVQPICYPCNPYYAFSIQEQQATHSVGGKVSRWLDYLSNPVYKSDEKAEDKTCLLEQTNNLELDFSNDKFKDFKVLPRTFQN